MTLRGCGDKTVELPNGRITYSMRAGYDLLKIFNTIIQFNGGIYQYEEQHNYVELTIKEDGMDFSMETCHYEVLQSFKKLLPNQNIIVVGGRWLPNTEEKPTPICSVYLIDTSGVLEKYKCRFTVATNTKYLKDYELDEINLVWSRKTGKIKKGE